MSTFHAVVWLDHSEAHVVMFDREHMEAQRIKSRSHHKHQGKTADNAAFFGDIATALAGTHEVLLAGPGRGIRIAPPPPPRPHVYGSFSHPRAAPIPPCCRRPPPHPRPPRPRGRPSRPPPSPRLRNVRHRRQKFPAGSRFQLRCFPGPP